MEISAEGHFKIPNINLYIERQKTENGKIERN